MRVTSKGQVTIPKPIRDHLGVRPGGEVDFICEGRDVKLVKASRQSAVEVARFKRLREAIERMRGSSTTGLTTEEIMRMTRGEWP
jgi:AbrB family looped-hinge helix DNA binding protein